MSKKVLMQGNQAVAEEALVARVKVCAGYPITPSSEIIEILLENYLLMEVDLFKWKMK